MEIYLQWTVVGVIVLAAVIWTIRRSRRKDDCSCGCGGCLLKDNCKSRKNGKNSLSILFDYLLAELRRSQAGMTAEHPREVSRILESELVCNHAHIVV